MKKLLALAVVSGFFALGCNNPTTPAKPANKPAPPPSSHMEPSKPAPSSPTPAPTAPKENKDKKTP